MKQCAFYVSKDSIKSCKVCCVGLCMNYESLLIANVVSGLVRQRYCKAPIIFLYSSIIVAVVPSDSLNETEVDSGVEDSLTPDIFVLSRISVIY